MARCNKCHKLMCTDNSHYCSGVCSCGGLIENSPIIEASTIRDEQVDIEYPAPEPITYRERKTKYHRVKKKSPRK